jgi:PKD repeat protein
MRISKAILIPAFLLFILGGCYKNEPVPAAAFTYTGTNGFMIPCRVNFINNSENSFSWEWNLGDDSISWDKAPVKVYTIPGKYVVTMRAYTESHKEWASVAQTIVIKDTVR